MTLAPITATGLPHSADPGRSGRDAQSTTCLSWPGRVPLYSGVENRTASAAPISSRRRGDLGGRVVGVVVLVVGREPLEALEQLDLDALGGESAAARSSAVLWEARRRLPEIARIRIITLP